MRRNIHFLQLLLLGSLPFSSSPLCCGANENEWNTLIRKLPGTPIEFRLEEFAQTYVTLSPATCSRGLSLVEKLLVDKEALLSARSKSRLHVLAANMATGCGQFEKSIRYAKKEYFADSSLPALLARDYVGLNRWEAAVRTVDDGLTRHTLSPAEKADLYFLRGQYFLVSKKYDLAVNCYREAMKIHPTQETLATLLFALNMDQRYNEALQAMESYGKEWPAPLSGLILIESAVSARHLHQFKKASDFCWQAYDGGMREAASELFLVLILANDRESMEKLITDNRIVAREDASYFARVGLECAKKSWFYLARDCFERVKGPVSADLLYSVASCEALNKMLELSKQHAEQLTLFDKNKVRARILLSDVLMRQGDFTAAVEALQPLVDDPFHRERALFMQGKIFLAHCDEEKATSIVKTLQREYPRGGHSEEKLRAALSSRFVSNLGSANCLRLSLIKQTLSTVKEELKTERSRQARRELFTKASLCTLLANDGTSCLSYIDNALMLGKRDYTMVSIRAAALDLLNRSGEAEKERDLALEQFSKSGENPLNKVDRNSN